MSYLILALISCVSGALIVDRPCPEVQPADNFSFESFHRGTWYEVARYQSNVEGAGDCVAIEHIVEGGRNKIRMNEVVQNKLKTVEVELNIDPVIGNSAVIDYASRRITETEGLDFIQLNVLDVDYDDYAILYGCGLKDKANREHEYTWIISRYKKLSDKAQAAVEAFISSNILQSDKLVWDHFSDDICRVN